MYHIKSSASVRGRPAPLDPSRSPTGRGSRGWRSDPWFSFRRPPYAERRHAPPRLPRFPTIRSPRRCQARTSPGTARYPSRRYAPHTRYIPFPPEPPGRWLETRPESLRGARAWRLSRRLHGSLSLSLLSPDARRGYVTITPPDPLSPAKTPAPETAASPTAGQTGSCDF